MSGFGGPFYLKKGFLPWKGPERAKSERFSVYLATEEVLRCDRTPIFGVEDPEKTILRS